MTKFKDKMNSYKKHPGSFLLFLLVVAAAIITVAVLLYLVAYILIHGVPYLNQVFSHWNIIRITYPCFQQ